MFPDRNANEVAKFCTLEEIVRIDGGRVIAGVEELAKDSSKTVLAAHEVIVKVLKEMNYFDVFPLSCFM